MAWLQCLLLIPLALLVPAPPFLLCLLTGLLLLCWPPRNAALTLSLSLACGSSLPSHSCQVIDHVCNLEMKTQAVRWRRVWSGDWRQQTRSPGGGHRERKGGDKLAQRVTWTCGHKGEVGVKRTQDSGWLNCWLMMMLLTEA